MFGVILYDFYLCGVGVWKEKVYYLLLVCEREDIDIFEIMMYVEEDLKFEWKEFDCMCCYFCDFLVDDFFKFEIFLSYFDELVFIYSFLWEKGVVYNLFLIIWRLRSGKG